MSTQIQLSPASGITVGTTAVTSGTIGRVFFQGTGNVVQQDAGFLFDSTAKTLTNYGKGAVTSNTSFGIGVFQNGTGAGTQNTAIGWGAANYLTSGSNNTMVGYRAGGSVLASNFTGNNNTLIGTGSGLYLSSGAQNTFVGNSTGTSVTTGSFNTIIGHYTGSLPATLAQNVIISDGNNQVALWMNSSQRVGFGFNPLTDSLGAKVDIKAQGALSTDIAFRVRNSANSADLFSIRGNGSQWIQSVPFIHGGTFTGGTSATQSLYIGYNSRGLGSSGSRNVIVGTGIGTDTFGVSQTAIGHNINTGSFSNAIAIGDGATLTANNSCVMGSESYPFTAMAIGTGGLVTSAANIQNMNLFVGGISGGYGQNTSAASKYFRLSAQNGTGTGEGSPIQFATAPSGAAGFSQNANVVFMEVRGDGMGLNHYQLSTPRVPSASIADGYIQYSNDIVAGNAAPHFRTENGNIIKLYRQSSAGITTVADLVTVLTNLGLLA